MVVCGLPILPTCISPRRAYVTAATVPSTKSARAATIGRHRPLATVAAKSTVAVSYSIVATGSGTPTVVLPAFPCGLSSKNSYNLLVYDSAGS